MDHFVDERDYKLLEKDGYTFFVLMRIMGGNCKLLLSDHERLILCFTEPPFPVWIWTPEDATEEEMEKAYRLAKENSLFADGCSFNIKYELAEYFIKRATDDGRSLTISMNMYAYDCPEPLEPEGNTDGAIHCSGPEDLEELVHFQELFHKEIGIDQKDAAGYRADAEALISSGNMYFWKDAEGHNVASCAFQPNGNMASVNLVYTHPEYRRKHYAEHLVYQVTRIVKDKGYVPMLYTNADYVASNACYEKIGYVLRGKLCTVG